MSEKTTTAQIANALLGGSEAGRKARDAAKLLDTIPGYSEALQDERDFMARAVSLAAESGVTQFLHLGCGYPLRPNMHETAWDKQANISAAYVDADPAVVSRTRTWLRRNPASSIITTEADVTSPETVIDQVKDVIDFSERVCILMGGLQHFQGSLAAATVHAWKAAVPCGSVFILSQVASNLNAAETAKGRSAYEAADAPFCPRSPATVRAYFNGVRMIDPGWDGTPAVGVADVARWGFSHPDKTGRSVIIGGTGEKK